MEADDMQIVAQADVEIERAAGTERPRLKFTSVEEMQAALSR